VTDFGGENGKEKRQEDGEEGKEKRGFTQNKRDRSAVSLSVCSPCLLYPVYLYLTLMFTGCANNNNNT